jgi:hypothetical protein
MANKTKATPQKEEMWDKGPEIPGAPPLVASSTVKSQANYLPNYQPNSNWQ